MRPSFSYIEPRQRIAALCSEVEQYFVVKLAKMRIFERQKSDRFLIDSRQEQGGGTYNLVGRKLGESSLFLRMSLHLFTVSNNRNVSPTENSVDRQLASSFRVGGPGEP